MSAPGRRGRWATVLIIGPFNRRSLMGMLNITLKSEIPREQCSHVKGEVPTLKDNLAIRLMQS